MKATVSYYVTAVLLPSTITVCNFCLQLSQSADIIDGFVESDLRQSLTGFKSATVLEVTGYGLH